MNPTRTLIATLVILSGSAVAQAQLPNGVASGDTTTDSTVLWARSLSAGALSFEVSTDPSFASGVTTINATVGADTLVPARAEVTGLAAGTRYYYRATDASGASRTGTFRTAAAAGERTGFRFGVSGDWRGDVGPFAFARNIPSRNLDLFVHLGDTVYGDVASPALPQSQAISLGDYRIRHAEIYSERSGLNTMADLRGSVSALAMIDDHEVTNDFSGYGTVAAGSVFANAGAPVGSRVNQSSLYNNGLQAFHDYHPIQQRTYQVTGDARTDGRPDLYRSQRYGQDAAVFMVDARSFRDESLPNVADPTNPAQIGGFIAQSFNPSRTMLGSRQFQRLASDLLTAQQAGVTWKFVHLPQPAQNLGVLNAGDRFEGYAAERAALLSFIQSNNIDNVVFVAADIHGTLVNNLTYSNGPGQPQIATNVWEITTGSGAYAAPFGPTVAGIAAQLNLPGALPLQTYLGLPSATQEVYVQQLINAQITPLGYSPLGLTDSGVPATLLQGTWSATNTYGWTEFDINPLTQALTVTTYGVPWYGPGTDPALIAALQPQIVQQFVVQAIPTPGASGLLALGLMLAARRRRR